MTSIIASDEQLVRSTQGSQPQVAALAGGGWVVTWESTGQDGSSYGYGVDQQAYNANGSVLGGETQVNTHVGGDLSGSGVEPYRLITALADGGWVVIWPLYDQTASSGWDVYQQAYHADGSVLGGETRANTTVTGDQLVSQVAALAGGGWVLTWDEIGHDDQGDVYQQAYHADGSALGGETRINTYAVGIQRDPAVVALAGGGWVVVWNSDELSQQAYKADGSALGGETQIASNGLLNSITALAGGGWLVTWQGSDEVGKAYNNFSPTGSSWGIYQQAYNADGSAFGGVTRVNTSTARDQTESQVTALAGGGWVVTWESAGAPDGSGAGLYQQAYNADGSALGSETLLSVHYQSVGINTTLDGYSLGEKTAALAGGGWVVIWENQAESFVEGIYQQVYNPDGSPLGKAAQIDTYTHDYDAPQIAALADGGWVVTWNSHFNAGFNTGYSDGVYQRVFHISASTQVRNDFNGDGKSGILWQNTDGTAAIWFMNGGAVSSAAGLGNPGAKWHVKTTADLDGDGKSDIVWQNDDGTAVVYLMNGATIKSIAGLGNPGAAWKIKAAGDLNGDGKADIVWQNDDGTAVVYLMNGSAVSSVAGLGNPGAAWKIKAAGDFNGDGKADILWQNDDGTAVIYFMNGGTVTSVAGLGNPGSAWHIRDAADFDGDGKTDILWQNDNGATVIWFMNGSTVTLSGGVGNPGPAWSIKSTGDINGDGKADITWQNTDGTAVVWLMNGSTVASYAGLGSPGTSWHVVTG